MLIDRAVTILTRLRDGLDHDGEPLGEDHPCQQVDVVRALYTVLAALPDAGPGAAAGSNGTRPPPANRGKPWTAEEDERLVRAYDEGKRESALASELERSRYAVRLRLEKLGKITPAQATV
jgi:hypothetical protein